MRRICSYERESTFTPSLGGNKRVVEVGWLRDDATVTVGMIPGKIDMNGPGFALAQLLEAIGNAEELQPAKEIPSKGAVKGITKARRKGRKS